MITTEVAMSKFEVFTSILLSTTNKMQRYTVFFIAVNALHVSGRETAQNVYSIDNNKNIV